MKRTKDTFLDSIETAVSLTGKNILEIGCGNGSRSVQIAKRCLQVTALEPNFELIAFARKNNSGQNIDYLVGKAEKLDFPDTFSGKKFDIAIFTLSLHHVPIELMKNAIDEAVRVTKKRGSIIFLEPTEEGTFFDAEVSFDASDGDERQEKVAAYKALKSYSGYREVAELQDETIFKFDSLDDFVTSMSPKKNIQKIESFLIERDFTLNAYRRITIFEV